ncbi:ISKra4 family transposase [Phormidesmis priestleyi]|uniref:ISKra4 family transposase n=1 Tax=Phormidesmis priestleyi TaxID=268141 RepID=UPI00083AD07E|nr:ISKra4 family transposase [Phormidesmis priestleyi]
MTVSIIERTTESVTIQIQIPLSSRSLLESEETIQQVLNEAGTLATGESLKQFASDGAAIEVAGEKWTSKGKQPKRYQTPGVVEIQRYVYQKSSGGATYCPLEVDGRIVMTSTPRFAKQISHKYAEMSSPRLVEDLEENHGRIVPRSFVQRLAEAVGSIALLKEEDWHYHTPKLSMPVTTISIGIDGTCLLLCEGGFRQAMVGTISLYDADGERQHTTYVAARPEYGRATFLDRMHREIEQVKRLYPTAHYQGLADSAPENWTFLEPLTETQVLDFYHATAYLDRVAKAVHPRSQDARKRWMQEQCHALKHEVDAATRLLVDMEAIAPPKSLSHTLRDGLQDAITYFRNHHHQMHYAEALSQHLPIGSGVAEAGCKVIIKARLCAAGMKWKEQGVAIVLSLRTLSYSQGRWQQFWSKINQYGFNLAET